MIIGRVDGVAINMVDFSAHTIIRQEYQYYNYYRQKTLILSYFECPQKIVSFWDNLKRNTHYL